MTHGHRQQSGADPRDETPSKSPPATAASACGASEPAGKRAPAEEGKVSAQLSNDEQLRQYRAVPFPLGDAEGERQAARKIHVNRAGANIFSKQTDWVAGDSSGVIADAFVMSIMKSVQARDAVEEMLCVQMAWTHARLGKLSMLAVDQTSTKNVQVVNEACDRAANTYRRQMLALSEYRNPRQGDTFTAIKQQNIANQQVVQNADKEDSQNKNTSNEQGSTAPAQLPSYEVGTGIPTPISRENEAVAVEHRPQDDSRQGALPLKRHEAR